MFVCKFIIYERLSTVLTCQIILFFVHPIYIPNFYPKEITGSLLYHNLDMYCTRKICTSLWIEFLKWPSTDLCIYLSILQCCTLFLIYSYFFSSPHKLLYITIAFKYHTIQVIVLCTAQHSVGCLWIKSKVLTRLFKNTKFIMKSDFRYQDIKDVIFQEFSDIEQLFKSSVGDTLNEKLFT